MFIVFANWAFVTLGFKSISCLVRCKQTPEKKELLIFALY